jgi:hypothetical protein
MAHETLLGLRQEFIAPVKRRARLVPRQGRSAAGGEEREAIVEARRELPEPERRGAPPRTRQSASD